MYFGSVRFFKHLIAATILIVIIALAIGIIRLVSAISDYKEQIETYKTAPIESNEMKPADQPSELMDYQNLYPELYADLPLKYIENKNIVYLTFDDGPSDRTIEILDILKLNNIKATFFIIGKDSEKDKSIMRRIVEEGHTIAIHTYSHKYNVIYDSVENYLNDFNEIYQLIYETTGVKPDIFRFPGGSLNTYNTILHTEIKAEMIRRGFTFYDWNATSGDAASSKLNKKIILDNVIKTSKNQERIILLMHDSLGKTYTASALPEIIEYYKTNGYQFDRLTNDVRPVSFSYNIEY